MSSTAFSCIASRCQICHDAITSPVLLHCLHEFCSSCLSSWVRNSSQPELDNLWVTACPVCDAQTAVVLEDSHELPADEGDQELGQIEVAVNAGTK